MPNSLMPSAEAQSSHVLRLWCDAVGDRTPASRTPSGRSTTMLCGGDYLLEPPSPKFQSILLYDQPFLRYRTIYNSRLTTMLKGQERKKKQKKKKEKNKQKQKKNAKNSNFLISQLFQQLWLRPSPGIHEFWGANLVYTFRDVV